MTAYQRTGNSGHNVVTTHESPDGNHTMISRLMDTYMKESQHIIKSIPEIFEIHKHLINELNAKDIENKEMLDEMRKELAFNSESLRREQRREYDKDLEIMSLNRKASALEHQLADSKDQLDAHNRMVAPLEQQVLDTKELLEARSQKVTSLEQQLSETRELLEAKSRKVSPLEQQLSDNRDLLEVQNRKVLSLENQLSKTEDLLEAQNRKISSLEEELSDTKDMIDSDRSDTEKYRQLADERQELLDELNVTNNGLTQDLSKANEIIRKLQTEMQSTHQKLLLLNKVTSKQEETVDLHHNAVQKLDSDLRHCSQQLKARDKEYQTLRKDFDALKGKCSETEAQLTANQNIISYLNQQLSELQAKHGIKSIDVSKIATQSSHKSTHPKVIAQRNAVFVNKSTKNDNLFRR
ncbi:unnamed protein product [Medioppia subpectinata]|uniref:Uncharacterized protein n=1 Tax=Medioppia subpectinata TaxID=1979941 RepID=A0A7R9KCU8_9ACAR|nr:unnamed protein product [Medioppia subpectinata]CAG2101141.1 unnamed protein product [Medioppia subpectinata]